MLTYIIRRLLLMIPTLFGITIIVFSIVRFAPGRPGTELAQGGQLDAEAQKVMREYYEKKFHLDKPLPVQYLIWWRSLFTYEVEAVAFTADYREIYTSKLPVDEYFYTDAGGQWYLATMIDASGSPLEQMDAQFTKRVAQSPDRERMLPVDSDYPVPRHGFAGVEGKAIDSLPADLVEPLTQAVKFKVQAPVWTRQGEPVYDHPTKEGVLLYWKAGAWVELVPSESDESLWTVYLQNDKSFTAFMPGAVYRKFTPVEDGRPVPRHVVVQGENTRTDQKLDLKNLERRYVEVESSIDVWLWTEAGRLVFKAADPLVVKFYRDSDDQWHRLIGDSLVEEPPFKVHKQNSTAFLANLSGEQIKELPKDEQGLGLLYSAVFAGRSQPVGEDLDVADMRRYSHETDTWRFTLGKSAKHKRPVVDELKSRLPITLKLNLIALPIIYIIAIPGGMLMGAKRGKLADRGSTFVMLAMWSVPTVLTATLAIGYISEGGVTGLDWFPNSSLKSPGYDSLDNWGKFKDQLWHLVLPISCMVYGGFAYLAKQMRASMLENFTQDYVRTAKAKGIGTIVIVLRHVFRNSLLPLITIFATILPAMIAGSLFIEKIFNIRGMGLFMFEAVLARDYDVVQSMALVASLLMLVGLLIADICYALVDPRIRLRSAPTKYAMTMENDNNPVSAAEQRDVLEAQMRRQSQAYWARIWREVKRRGDAIVAIVMLVFLASVAVIAPLIANHRPFVLYTPEDGYQFPLFRQLAGGDWILLGASFCLIWMLVWYRSWTRRDTRPSRLTLVVWLAALFGTVPWALAQVPWESTQVSGSVTGSVFSVIVGVCLFILIPAAGLFILGWGAVLIWTDRSDDFGNSRVPGGFRRLLVGTIMVLVFSAFVGALGRSKLDTTNYLELGRQEGAWTMFAPIAHDYKGQDPSWRNRRPLDRPSLSVEASGQSKAAEDLFLLSTQDTKGLIASVKGGEVSADTPITALRNGEGMRSYGRRRPDFTVKTTDLTSRQVSMYKVETLGDVVEAISKAGTRDENVYFTVRLDPEQGIVITDLTPRPPLNVMGTDDSGADVAARMILATRVALAIGFVSTTIAILIGVSAGALMGYFGGWVDAIGMRIIEMFMTVPRIFLLLTIIAVFPPQWNPYMIYAMMVVIGLTSWMGAARFIRAEFFRLREMDFIQAARACGLPLRSLLFKHMLPNGVAPVLVDASFMVAAGIFVETGLSFLGFGIKPPDPSWGQMLSAAIDPSTGVFRWWLAVFPGIMIFLTVFSYNLLGDAMRDAIDPRLKKASNL